MSDSSKQNFEQTMQIAEFAAERLENRRQYEFKIFISYVTLLVLAIYEKHHIEVLNSNAESPYKWYGLGLLFLMHFFYISWTISLSVANRNDSDRRNYYLRKAECIWECFLKKVCDPPFRKIESDYDSMTKSYKIKIVPKALGALKHGDQIWINYAATFQIVLPTVIFSVLVHILFDRWGLTIIPFLFLVILCTTVYGVKRLIKWLKCRNKSSQ